LLKVWSQDMPSYQKKDVLLQLAQQMTTRKEEVARVISMEAGKPINDARIEVDVRLRPCPYANVLHSQRSIDTFTVSGECKSLPKDVLSDRQVL
jgi:acyl-CoA reductase-like NAD-dependent aldehyde dehydrogenase